MSELLLDAAGRRRSPATLPHFHVGRPPRNKGVRLPRGPADGRGNHRRHARRRRRRAWPPVARADCRALVRRPAIHEALALTEADLDARRGSLLVRRGKGGRAARLAWTTGRGATRAVAQGARRAAHRTAVLRGQRSDPWTALVCLGRALGAAAGGAPGRCAAAVCAAPARHAHAVEMAREGVPLIVIQRQLGHTNLGITSIYLQGIDNAEIIDTVHARRAPMVPVHSSLQVRTERDRRQRSPDFLAAGPRPTGAVNRLACRTPRAAPCRRRRSELVQSRRQPHRSLARKPTLRPVLPH